MSSSTILPNVEGVDTAAFSTKKRRLLITAEGFEDRSLSFLSVDSTLSFQKIIICKYAPPKKSRVDDLYRLAMKRCQDNEIYEETYNRFDPFNFEIIMQNHMSTVHLFDEIVIDISVMSKYMIMQILGLMVNYENNVRIIYTEPVSYAPLESSCSVAEQDYATQLPSYGVQNIVRTPLLSSIIMQRSPTLLIAFLSFNEQLIRALLTEYNPARLFLVNGKPSHLVWRKKSMNDIHKSIIKEYHMDNPVDENNLLVRESSTLNYIETIVLLAEIYRDYGEDYRIVFAPTGSKMQALSCALVKNCCADIHIEYPTPESYYIDGYSSSEIREIHQVYFRSFKETLSQMASGFGLHG